MDIVTIACERDKFDIQAQAFGINKFITNDITHWIVVEDGSDEQMWRELLEPYYTRHRLKLLISKRDPELQSKFRQDRLGYGWRRQQILKLETTAKYVETEKALVLDAKNIFVNYCDTTKWPIKHGNGEYLSWEKITSDFSYISIQVWLEHVSRITGRPIPDRVSAIMETPFVWQVSTVQELWNDFDVPGNMLLENVIPNSEFHTYHFYVNKDELDEPTDLICRTEIFWDIPEDITDMDYVLHRIAHCDRVTSPSHGFHSRERYKMSVEAKEYYINWLCDRGYERSIAYNYMYKCEKFLFPGLGVEM